MSEAPVVKEFVIQPVGFIVAPKAEKYHGISHERALLIGKPLRDMLQELLVMPAILWICITSRALIILSLHGKRDMECLTRGTRFHLEHW